MANIKCHCIRNVIGCYVRHNITKCRAVFKPTESSCKADMRPARWAVPRHITLIRVVRWELSYPVHTLKLHLFDMHFISFFHVCLCFSSEIYPPVCLLQLFISISLMFTSYNTNHCLDCYHFYPWRHRYISNHVVYLHSECRGNGTVPLQ